MLQHSVSSPRTMWLIVVIGLLTGLIWGVLDEIHQVSGWRLYLLSLSFSAASVLAFTLTSMRQWRPWLCTVLVLPVQALMTGWLRWTFPDTLDSSDFAIDSLLAQLFFLFLIMPLIQAWCDTQRESWGKSATDALWHNSFTVLITALMTGVFWLVLLLWGKLFKLIGIELFEDLFFRDHLFPPIATGGIVATGIVLCRNLPKTAQMFRQLFSLLSGVLQPLHALISLVFLACLVFTGLTIIPAEVSSATLLVTMALIMLLLGTINAGQEGTLRYPRWLIRAVWLVQCLTPLLAILAVYALWVRIAQYGWTASRVEAAIVVALTLLWSLMMVTEQWKNWDQPGGNIPRLNVIMLALITLSWCLLHSPLLDPYRIEVNSQLARYSSGKAKADTMDLYSFSKAGRRGDEALQQLQQHPEWIKSGEDKYTLSSMLPGHNSKESHAVTVAALQEKISLREHSPAPEEGWWQYLASGPDSHFSLSCLDKTNRCLVWLLDLNNDNVPEVLLYNRDLSRINIYQHAGAKWSMIGEISGFSSAMPAEKVLEQGHMTAQEKRWHDLNIDGTRYPVQYYGTPEDPME
ncbi:DUF4153 domain-containing protein [Pantoea sp. A4]|uniref:DUF4153 domain-containing protein n=1 Tax=Pantoea sp. A4 TaxID=1225184 RepID=UPI00036B5ED4|nr:DUF4153 domain-containing protein [Pantoea sp. A4]